MKPPKGSAKDNSTDKFPRGQVDSAHSSSYMSPPPWQSVHKASGESRSATAAACFEENNNVVQFEVDRGQDDEFPSEGEVTDSDTGSEDDDEPDT